MANPAQRRAMKFTLSVGLRGLGIIAVTGAAILGFTRPWHSTTKADTPDTATLTVRTEAVKHMITVAGTIQPGSVVSVVAPYDGTIAVQSVAFGDQIAAGAALVTLDTAEAEVRLRDATSAFLKAKIEVDVLEHWKDGAEAARARRALLQTEMQRGQLAQNLVAAKTLFERGIIARQEVDGLEQQLRAADLQLDNSRQDLETTLARGSAENQTIAGLELENARQKLTAAEHDLAAAKVTAPVSGVVLPPPPTGGTSSQAPSLEIGARVQRGQALLLLGALATFSATAKVDELDVASVHPGQPVSVTGDGFPDMVMTGHVRSVASTSNPGSGAGLLAAFRVAVALDALGPELRSRLRLGMSCSLAITVYDRPDAIVVPPDAIIGTAGSAAVFVQNKTTGGFERRPVVIGASTTRGIEIMQGLASGDTIRRAGDTGTQG